ncbi:MAG TPA: ROK family protein [Acidimicrobiales bacterium]|nr:ROK family protein [Acidimicrobiales bacterium]
MAAAIGIDLGGTKIYGVRMKGDEIAAEAKVKTPVSGGPLAVVDAIAGVVKELGGDSKMPIGVGAPGVIDTGAGVVKAAPNLHGWIEAFPLGPSLSDALDGARVVVDNDVNVATLAEHRRGAGDGVDELLCVFVGTGVGGGLVLEGEMRRGPNGMAGEIGHIIVEPDGRLCGCGGHGHLEAYAGRAGMERRARELEADGHDTLLVEIAKGKRMTSSVWGKALAQGDAVAMQLIDEAVAALGQGLAAVVTVLDLDLVVLGGGLTDRLGPSFVGRVEEATRSRLFGGASPLRVVAAGLGDGAGAVGAALLADGA